MKKNLFKIEMNKDKNPEKKEQNNINTEINNYPNNNNVETPYNIQGMEIDGSSFLFEDYYDQQYNNNEGINSLNEVINEIDIENSQNISSNEGIHNNINNFNNNNNQTSNNVKKDSIFYSYNNFEKPKTRYLFAVGGSYGK